MNYIKAEWRILRVGDVSGDPERITIVSDKRSICQIHNINLPEAEGNAQLIATAVNACISINPDNPLAVAESIKEMYEALKSLSLGDVLPEYRREISKILVKVEGK